MRNVPSAMGWALLLSLVLHAGAVAILNALLSSPAPPREREPAALDVRLREPPAARPPEPAAPVPRLMLPKESLPNAIAARRAPAAGIAPRAGDSQPRGLAGEAARIAYRQMQGALLYPREAIEQGIEGEATVLLFLDERGDAIAARLEASSGSTLLDDAAVRAARTLRSLPAAAPREALLPVRFRLR
jgi:protein TonB